MRYVITGAGQIGAQLAHDLVRAGHQVTVVRRSAAKTDGPIRAIAADVLNVDAWSSAAEDAAAIFHCIHAPYDSRVWARELPQREQAVLSIAEQHGIPVIFPESVYAFGEQAKSLHEGAPLAPVTPLGQVRADLLRARAQHSAVTLSVVASDLIGPTTGAGSVATATVLRPLAAGRRAWVFANPDLPHSWTYTPDLAAAMLQCADRATSLAPSGDAVLHCPTTAPRSLRELASDAADLLGCRARVQSVPRPAMWAARWLHPLLRELDRQQYLWRQPSVLRPGRLMTTDGTEPTPWEAALRVSVDAVRSSQLPTRHPRE